MTLLYRKLALQSMRGEVNVRHFGFLNDFMIRPCEGSLTTNAGCDECGYFFWVMLWGGPVVWL